MCSLCVFRGHLSLFLYPVSLPQIPELALYTSVCVCVCVCVCEVVSVSALWPVRAENSPRQRVPVRPNSTQLGLAPQKGG